MYELAYETPMYDQSSRTFHYQEADKTDSWGNLKAPGYFHQHMRQIFSLRQKEAEIKLLRARYIDTSVKLQDLSPVLDDRHLLAEL
jgi:hypothetical protein